MNTLNAILIDDEISNLKGLGQKLAKFFPNIIVTNSFQKPENAINFLNTEDTDLVFLDIQMPRINGFELLSHINNINFQVIFVTAYSEYAIEAFKRNAVDYVLKPIDNIDLQSAVNKAIHIISLEDDTYQNLKLVNILTEISDKNNKIIVPTQKGISFIPEDEVLHIEGYKGYSKIHLQNKTDVISSYSLGKFEELTSNKFFKCHKSHIINIQKVSRFENEGYIILDNNYRVPIARSQKKVFLELFKL